MILQKKTNHKVGHDIVTAPLAKKGHPDNHVQPIASRSCVHKLAEIPPVVVGWVEAGLLDNLAVLELDDRVVAISLTVVLG